MKPKPVILALAAMLVAANPVVSLDQQYQP
jgi:hypothetical protein